ncbi:MAG: bifunctional glutamate N-acetyltransferase/amino-acid acetyltransferase ArgJ [Verrucomicrobiota bacterium]|nr:bifunctional glutamate N-acetyltransferase/amino-acid acetyltransferase ArgJ [Verrucomicrobiota bacterium]
MQKTLKTVLGSIVAPRGFRAAGVFCDIKRLGTGKGSEKGRKRDLAIIVSDVPAVAAGMFTTNQVKAAPVQLCIRRIAKGRAQAIVANSGNANASTGALGLKNAEEMASEAARLLHLPEQLVLVASTGRIGVQLPMPNVRRGIRKAVSSLGGSPEHAAEAAEAIMTSDTLAKTVSVEFAIGGRQVRIGGICKGAGMIQPGMSPTGQRPAAIVPHATMLAFLTTDVAIEAPALRAALCRAVAASFNRITVDGDMSTNDTVLVLANGLASNNPIRAADYRPSRNKTAGAPPVHEPISAPARVFQAALDHVCLTLAHMIVRDGEGATRFVTVRVEGARSVIEADAAARAVANSALVKTSWYGGDPNWGRILDAVGYSSARIAEEKIDIGYSAPGSRRIVWCFKKGQPTKIKFDLLRAAVAPRQFDLHIRLNVGRCSAVIYAADLTEAYVDFNKGDLSNPSALGG